MNKSYIIIPGCCDLNRGDQALGWETARIAQDAGYIGTYSILAERGEPIEQSVSAGFEVIVPILEHPSRKFQNKENIVYDKKTKIKWGLVAIKDFIFSFLLFLTPFRNHVKKYSKDKKLVQTIIRFEESDKIFMKGGGLIQSHGGILSTYATYYRLYHIFFAHALKIPVYIMPNSFGPFEGPGVKWMVRKVLKKCCLVTARERKSVEVVKQDLNLDIALYPDLAFYLQNGDINRQYLCQKYNIDNNRKIVALTMRPYRFPNSSNPEESYAKFKHEMGKFIVWLYEVGYAPLIVEHTFAITSHENDGDCIKDVIKDLDRKYFSVVSDRTLNCNQLKSLYGSCDYIIGTRFHSMIFSLCNSIPGIAISYDGYKSIGIMQDMDLSQYVIDIGSVTSNKLSDMFEDMLKNEMLIRTNIEKYIEKANSERNRLIAQLKE